MPTQDQHEYHFKLSDECCLCYTQTHTQLRGKLLLYAPNITCQARESNPGIRCCSVMFYHCSTERCWTQMRGTTKVTKNSPLFPRAKTKELSIQIPTKKGLGKNNGSKNKVLRRAKNTLSRRQMLPTFNGKNYNRTQRNKRLKNLQRSQRHNHSSIIQQE